MIETAPNNPYKRDTPEKSVGILQTKFGIFAIKINDFTKLLAFTTKYESKIANGEELEYVNEEFSNPEKYNIRPESTYDQQVTGFLRFLKDEDIGVDLYEGNKDNFGSWSKLTLQDNSDGTYSHTAVPCN